MPRAANRIADRGRAGVKNPSSGEFSVAFHVFQRQIYIFLIVTRGSIHLQSRRLLSLFNVAGEQLATHDVPSIVRRLTSRIFFFPQHYPTPWARRCCCWRHNRILSVRPQFYLNSALFVKTTYLSYTISAAGNIQEANGIF